MEPADSSVTRWLGRWKDGDPTAFEHILPLVYEELRALARRQLRGQRNGHTLQPTALVHEAVAKLLDGAARNGGTPLADRRHLVAFVARTMRSILIDHVRRKRRLKRTPPAEALPFPEWTRPFEERAIDLLALDAALERLGAFDPQLVRVVEMRFFAMLSLEATAEALGVSTRTVEREWQAARTWLKKEIEGSSVPIVPLRP